MFVLFLSKFYAKKKKQKNIFVNLNRFFFLEKEENKRHRKTRKKQFDYTQNTKHVTHTKNK